MIQKLFYSFIFAFLYGCFIHNPLYAIPVNDQPTNFSEAEQQPPPPLGPACGSGGLPGGLRIDPNNPVCCVNGYVYLNGIPVRDATITVEAINDEGVRATRTVTTPVGLNYLLHVDSDIAAVTDSENFTITVESYTVIEENENSYTYMGDTLIEKTTEDFIYQVSPLQLGDLDIHIGEIITIVTSYIVRGDNSQEAHQYTTRMQVPEPSFNMKLHENPLNVKPGDYITMTIELDGIQQQKIVQAQSGTIQVDTVMPNTRVDSLWVSHYLAEREDYASVYDAKNQQLVLFGGRDATGSVLNDTWVRQYGQNDAPWVQLTPTAVRPSPRSGHTLLYHERYEAVLLFGGQDEEGSYLNDFWAWDGTKWSELLIAGPTPSPRSHHRIVYDATNSEAVLFGGITGSEDTPELLADTWVFYGRRLESALWEQLALDVSPPGRLRHAMAYDSNEGNVVLFGGRSDFTGAELSNDTWIWDGANWEQKPSGSLGPVAREGHILSIKDVDQTVYLSGGKNQDGEILDDSWTWNGSTWVQVEGIVQQPNAPQPNFITWQGTAMAYEQKNEQESQHLIFGGLADVPQAKTYRWQNSDWQELNPQNRPPARYHHTLTSGNSPSILLFGGLDDAGNHLNDTWLWNGQNWQQQNTGPTPRIHHAMAYDRTRKAWLLFGGMDQVGNSLNDFWTFKDGTWGELTPSNSPTARKGATLVYDVSEETVILFGGQDSEQYFNDLWVWKDAQWERKTFSGNGPSQRTNHGAAFYEGNLSQMIISGGEDADGELTDTWSWDGSGWHIHYTKQKSPFYLLSSLYYDSNHKQLIGMGTNNAPSTGNMLLTYQVQDGPISTISYLTPTDLFQHEVIYFGGRGADTDTSNVIQAHRWTNNGEIISEQATFTTTAEILPVGTSIIGYAVQDDEGKWSQEQFEEIIVRQSERAHLTYLPTVMR